MSAPALWSCALSAVLAACGGDAGQLAAAAHGIDAAGRMHPGPEDRCPVCAMTTAERKLVSAIELDDGATFYCCGTRCLLRAWLAPQQFLAAGTRTIARARTVDYFTGEHVDAAAVHWVAGADLQGPMGKLIAPLLGDEALAKFRERHGGGIVFRLPELDEALWQRVVGGDAKGDAGR
jgi:nitrous oxide reductase accessory protein NosL